MKYIIFSIYCLILIFSGAAYAQKQKPAAKKPVNTIRSAREPEVVGDHFFFVTSINAAGNTSTVLQNENGTQLTPSQTAAFFSRLSRMGNNRLSTEARETLAPGVILKPDRSLKYKTLAATIRAIRDPSNLRVMIEADNGFFINVPRKPAAAKTVVPNPLYLVARLDGDTLDLNGEPQGRLSDTSGLTQFLKRIFKERADNGVFREGTNLVETAVFVNLPENASVADLMKIAEAIRNAGSDTVGLEIDPVDAMIRMVETPGN